MNARAPQYPRRLALIRQHPQHGPVVAPPSMSHRRLASQVVNICLILERARHRWRLLGLRIQVFTGLGPQKAPLLVLLRRQPLSKLAGVHIRTKPRERAGLLGLQHSRPPPLPSRCPSGTREARLPKWITLVS